MAERFPLVHGGSRTLRIAWQVAGAPGAPAVCVLGGISADRCVADGWWPEQVGAGRALDLNRCRVVAIDFLGGNGLSSGPRTDAALPGIDTHDQARAVARVLRLLEIERLKAFVGSSYGGMVGLAFAELFPAQVGRLVAISAGHEAHPQATAWRSIQRRIVREAAAAGRAAEGLALARGLAMVTYRSAQELAERFAGAPECGGAGFRFPVENYLEARGAEFAARFHPDAFLALSESIDLHRVDPGKVAVPTTLVGVRSDQLVPVEMLRRLRDRLGGPAELIEFDSLFGHDAFLKETDTIDAILRNALEAC